MTFERSTDYELVRRILTEPRCYARMRSDAAPSPDDFQIGPAPDLEYILAWENGSPIGIFLLAGDEVHFCLTPATWGRTEQIARAFLAWVWANTKRARLVGPVPAYNRLALRLALAVGFRQAGVEPGARMKHGRPYDLLLLEIEKPR